MKKYFFTLCFLLTPIFVNAQTDTSVCFCVTLARQYSSAVPHLDAKYWYLLPQTLRTVPVIGGQILMKYETLWDVGTVVGFGKDGFEVIGVDFDNCSATHRIVPWNDPRIYAFFNF